jgi:hypothetical protein
METSPHVFDTFSKTMKAQEQQEIDKLLTQKSRWKQVIAFAEADDSEVRPSEAAGSLDVAFQDQLNGKPIKQA